MPDALAVLSVLTALLLSDTPKANQNELGLTTHPRLWVHHTWAFSYPTVRPALPEGDPVLPPAVLPPGP